MGRRTPFPDPPEGLDAAQQALWRSLGEQRGGRITAADLILLRSVVDVSARLDAVRSRLDAAELVTSGSVKQQRAHPLLAVEVQLRAELDARQQGWTFGGRGT